MAYGANHLYRSPISIPKNNNFDRRGPAEQIILIELAMIGKAMTAYSGGVAEPTLSQNRFDQANKKQILETFAKLIPYL